jgi:hypothetical protein
MTVGHWCLTSRRSADPDRTVASDADRAHGPPCGGIPFLELLILKLTRLRVRKGRRACCFLGLRILVATVGYKGCLSVGGEFLLSCPVFAALREGVVRCARRCRFAKRRGVLGLSGVLFWFALSVNAGAPFYCARSAVRT